MNPKTINFRKVLDLEPSLSGKAIIGSAVCYDGTLAVLATEASKSDLPFNRIEQPGFASFPNTHSTEPYVITLFRFGPAGLIQQIELPAADRTYPVVQILPNGETLLVSTRCKRTKNGPEQNACIFSETGKLERIFCLGDGIEQVQVSANGEIWVSYFDEGVFGNFG